MSAATGCQPGCTPRFGWRPERGHSADCPSLAQSTVEPEPPDVLVQGARTDPERSSSTPPVARRGLAVLVSRIGEGSQDRHAICEVRRIRARWRRHARRRHCILVTLSPSRRR
jgi:hypothetical protein